jgi:hypothetical protein
MERAATAFEPQATTMRPAALAASASVLSAERMPAHKIKAARAHYIKIGPQRVSSQIRQATFYLPNFEHFFSHQRLRLRLMYARCFFSRFPKMQLSPQSDERGPEHISPALFALCPPPAARSQWSESVCATCCCCWAKSVVHARADAENAKG